MRKLGQHGEAVKRILRLLLDHSLACPVALCLGHHDRTIPPELWHPWVRVERVLRVILTERWSAKQWQRVKVEIPKVFAQRNRMKGRGRR